MADNTAPSEFSTQTKPPYIIDIRHANFEASITDQVITGLSTQPKTLPALLFYSTEGLKHWNCHSHQPDFYPRHQEIRILKEHAYDIASTIVQNSIIVDLGSASLEKVVILLEALEAQKKNISYYALDVSAEQLISTLGAIPIQKFRHCRFFALHGTFDDGLTWLKETPGIRDLPHCLLLFGLTIGNFSRNNAAKFLRHIAAHCLVKPEQGNRNSQAPGSILVTLDSCKVPTQVLRAYTSDGVIPFALAALKYANELFSRLEGAEITEIFNPDDWFYMSEWNHALGRHEASILPRSDDIKLRAQLNNIIVKKDERVRFGCSYKYNQAERDTLFTAAALKNAGVWSSGSCDVAFYRLELPSESSSA